MSLGIWQLLVILAIVLIIFGTKKIRSLGGDLGGAIRSFKQAVKEEGEAEEEAGAGKADERIEKKPAGQVIEGKVQKKKKARS